MSHDALLEEIRQLKEQVLTQLSLGKNAPLPGALIQRFRQQTAMLSHLPPAFGQVLENVLQRLEAGAMFTEESCSFSQTDLLENLKVWLDKAHARLQSAA